MANNSLHSPLATQDASDFMAMLPLSEVPDLLRLKEQELLSRHADALNLFDAERTSAETEQLIKSVRKVERGALMLRAALNEAGQTGQLLVSNYAVTDLRERCDRILQGTAELAARLGEDKKNLEQNEDKRIFNLMEIFSYSLIFPFAAHGLAELYSKSQAIPKVAPAVVMTAGLTYHFHKNIRAMWRMATKEVMPQKIVSSLKKAAISNLTVYYLTVKGIDKVSQTKACFRKGLVIVTRRVSPVSRKIRNIMNRTRGPRGPS